MQGIEFSRPPKSKSISTVPNSEKGRVEENRGLEKKVSSLRPTLSTLFSKRPSIGSNTIQIEEHPLANKSTQDTSNLQVTEANEKIRKEIKELKQLTSFNFNYSDSKDAKISKEDFQKKLISVINSLKSKYSEYHHLPSEVKKAIYRLGLKAVILTLGIDHFYSNPVFSEYKELPEMDIRSDSSPHNEDVQLLKEMNQELDSLLKKCFTLKGYGYLENLALTQKLTGIQNHPSEILNQMKEEFTKIDSQNTAVEFIEDIFKALNTKISKPISINSGTGVYTLEVSANPHQLVEEQIDRSSPSKADEADNIVAKLENWTTQLLETINHLQTQLSSEIESSNLKLEIRISTLEKTTSQLEQSKKEIEQKIKEGEAAHKETIKKLTEDIELLDEKFQSANTDTSSTIQELTEKNKAFSTELDVLKQNRSAINPSLMNFETLERQVMSQSTQISEQNKLIEDLSSQIEILKIELQKVTESKSERTVSSQPSSPFQEQKEKQEVPAQASLSPEVKKHEELIPSTTEKQASLDTEIERKVEALQEEGDKKSENSLVSSPPAKKESTPGGSGVIILKNRFEQLPQNEQTSPSTPTRIDSLQGNVGTLRTMWTEGPEKKSGPVAEAIDALQLKGAVAAHRATSQAQANPNRLSDPTLSDTALRAKKKK